MDLSVFTLPLQAEKKRNVATTITTSIIILAKCLRHFKSGIEESVECEYLHVCASDLTAERMPPLSKRPDRSEVLQFDQSKLHHVPTTEKVVLPSKEGKCIVMTYF